MSRIRITSGLRTGKIIEIPLGERCVMGRSKSADVTIADRRMSRTHCVVESTPTGYVLTDLDSANGTWMAGQRVTEVTLKSQDTFKMGNTELLFEDKADYSDEQTQVKIATKISTRRSKMSAARQAAMGQQDDFISAKSSFCETCGRHITQEDRDVGDAKQLERLWLCPVCVPRYKRLMDMGQISSVKEFTAWLRQRERMGARLAEEQQQEEQQE